jgi:hypothetical protein
LAVSDPEIFTKIVDLAKEHSPKPAADASRKGPT